MPDENLKFETYACLEIDDDYIEKCKNRPLKKKSKNTADAMEAEGDWGEAGKSGA